tara:strand:- start:270 stop:548 length:279 start_codon:yes stop_codon:yes gene_type:complete
MSTEEYVGEYHTDPTLLDEIAYTCFWFEDAKLEEELYRNGIPVIVRVVNDMLDRVSDRMHMWENFRADLLRLKEEANLIAFRDKLLNEKEEE